MVVAAIGFTLFGIGLGFYVTPSTDAALSSVPAEKPVWLQINIKWNHLLAHPLEWPFPLLFSQGSAVGRWNSSKVCSGEEQIIFLSVILLPSRCCLTCLWYLLLSSPS